MRNATKAILAATALLAIGGSVLALDGKNGYTAAEVIRWDQTKSLIEYDPSFTGVEYTALVNSRLGGIQSGPGQVAGSIGGDLFFTVHGGDGALHGRTSLIHYDGSRFVHLVQYAFDANTDTGTQIDRVRVSPVTSGRLTAEHPVILRAHHAAGVISEDLVSIDATTSPATETVVHALPTSVFASAFDIGDDGTIYVLDEADHSIRTLTFDAGTGAYVEGSVPTSLEVRQGVTVGPDGFLYAFAGSTTETSWGVGLSVERVVYRIDPVSGTSSNHASVQKGTRMFDWVWDSSGQLWAGLVKRRGHYVTEIVPGAVTSQSDAVSASSRPPWNLGAGADGALYVMEFVSGPVVQDTIHLLTPTGGGNDGGGGNGNGKGKNK